jgi:hypothetical protein
MTNVIKKHFRREDVVDGNMEYIRENFHVKFSAAFIFCPHNTSSIPTSVSIYARSDVKDLKNNSDTTVNLPKAPNRVLVNSKKEIKEPGATMAACVAPLHSQFSTVGFFIALDLNCSKSLILGMGNH